MSGYWRYNTSGAVQILMSTRTLLRQAKCKITEESERE